MINGDILSKDLIVCRAIYFFSKVKREKIWFSKLERFLREDAARGTISKSLDKLFDLGIIDGEWQKIEGKWTRTFKIAGEAEDFIKHIYENTKEDFLSDQKNDQILAI